MYLNWGKNLQIYLFIYLYSHPALLRKEEKHQVVHHWI